MLGGFGSDPRRLFSITYRLTLDCHGRRGPFESASPPYKATQLEQRSWGDLYRFFSEEPGSTPLPSQDHRRH